MKEIPMKITSVAVAATMLIPLSGCTLKSSNNNSNNDNSILSQAKDEYDKEVDKRILTEVIPNYTFNAFLNSKDYKFEYIVNLDELVEDNSGQPVLMAALLTSKTYSNRKKISGKKADLSEWFKTIDKMVAIPNEYSWIDKDSFYSYLDKEVNVSLYRVENGIYYACYNIIYTFNDSVKEIFLSENSGRAVPRVGDKICVNRVNAVVYNRYNNEIKTITVANNEYGDFNLSKEISGTCFGNPNSISKITDSPNMLVRKKYQ